MTQISTLSLQLISNANLQGEQNTLTGLNEQLASNQQHDNLTDYTPIDALNLMSFQNAITQKQAYVSSMQTVSTRLNVYDATMTDMENIASQASTLAAQNSNINTSQVGSLQQQAQSLLQQVTTDLNQQVAGRYIYAGTRYATQPVIDAQSILGLATPATNFSPVDNSQLPPYDTNSGTVDANLIASAWAQDKVTVDTNDTLTYGVTSTQGGFQRLVAGLQLIYAATQTADPVTYQQDMTAASGILSTSLTDIQGYHSGVAAATNTLTQEQATQSQNIDNLQNQISNVQSVNLSQVGTELNLLQTQLQASYSATSTLIQNSILKYL